MFAGLDILIPAGVTEVVFVFLCSKPAFALAALIAGLVAYRRADSASTPQLPSGS